MEWCDICSREFADLERHANQTHGGERGDKAKYTIEELHIALAGCTVDSVTPLTEGEGGVCILHVTTPEGVRKQVFLRRSLGFWFTEVR